MSRESSHNAIIIKRQPLGEADEIITLFTENLGKVRVKAAGSKLSTSKLQFGIQPGFLVTVSVAGNSHLPKLIGVQVRQTFPRLHQEASLIQAWFVIAELLLKSTADEQANPALFAAVMDCLNALEREPLEYSSQGLLKFKIDLLKAIGLGIPSEQLAATPDDGLHNFVNEFLLFQLEREIKSQRFLEESAVA